MADRMCFDCGAIFAEGGPLTAPNGGHTAGCYSDDPDVREVVLDDLTEMETHIAGEVVRTHKRWERLSAPLPDRREWFARVRARIFDRSKSVHNGGTGAR